MIIIIYKGLKKGGKNLNFFLELGQEIENKMSEMGNKSFLDILKSNNEEFVVDRFEGDIAILENRNTKEMIEVDRKELPDTIKEGEYLNRVNGKFIKNEEKNIEISERIKKKMDNLWE